MPKTSPSWFIGSNKARPPRTKGFPVHTQEAHQRPQSGQSGETAQGSPAPADRQLPKPQALTGRRARLVLAGAAALTLAAVAYAIGSRFSGPDAYGTIDGRVVKIASPHEGVAEAIHVGKGDVVCKGQLLIEMDSPKLERELAQLRDDLRMARATLDAELAKLRWNLHLVGDRRENVAKVLGGLSQALVSESAAVADIELQLDAARTMRCPNSALNGNNTSALGDEPTKHARGCEQRALASEGRFRSMRQNPLRSAPAPNFSKPRSASLRRNVLREEPGERLPTAMEETEMDVSRLNTVLSRIQELQKAILDKKANLERCEIRSPTDGIVIANQRFSGERIAAADALVEILEKDSLEAVVYFPRDRAQQIKLGETVALAVGRHRTPITGVVCRIEDPAGPPPSSIRRFYAEGQDFKAVHLKPSVPPGAELELRLGSIVKVPNRRRSFLAGTPCPTPDVSAADFDHDGEHKP